MMRGRESCAAVWPNVRTGARGMDFAGEGDVLDCAGRFQKKDWFWCVRIALADIHVHPVAHALLKSR